MRNETAQERGEREALERTLKAIRTSAIAMLGDSPEVRVQVERVSLDIEAMSSGSAMGSELAAKSVKWEILDRNLVG